MSKKLIIKKSPDILDTIPTYNSYVGLSQEQLLQTVRQLHEQISKINKYLVQFHRMSIFDFDVNDNDSIEIALPENKRGYLLDSTIKFRGEWDPINNIPKIEMQDRSKAGWAYITTQRVEEHITLGFIKEGDFLLYNAEGTLFNLSNIINARGEGPHLELGETDTTALRGDLGKIAYDHTFDEENPHNITPEQLGVYTKVELDNKLATAMEYKGSVSTKGDLPMTGNVIGDFYNVRDNGVNYAWDGSSWDQVGGFTDMIFNQITAKDVMTTLKDGHDVTFTHQDLDSIYVIVPEIEHGYFSGFNYRTKNKDIPTTIINNSGFPLKIFKYNLQMSSIEMSPNKVVNVSLHCDGINLYMYYTEN